jgi:hypothetical protein
VPSGFDVTGSVGQHQVREWWGSTERGEHTLRQGFVKNNDKETEIGVLGQGCICWRECISIPVSPRLFYALGEYRQATGRDQGLPTKEFLFA